MSLDEKIDRILELLDNPTQRSFEPEIMSLHDPIPWAPAWECWVAPEYAGMSAFWRIESTNPTARCHHLATEGTTEPLCQVPIGRGSAWRTPLSKRPLRIERPCRICLTVAEQMGLR